jgi:hypothetical protein
MNYLSSALSLEAQLQAVLETPPKSGWPADAQRLRTRLQKQLLLFFLIFLYTATLKATQEKLCNRIAYEDFE